MRFRTRPIAIAALLVAGLLSTPRTAQAWWFDIDWDDDESYRECAETLLKYDDLDPTLAASACAGALEPEEVSECVTLIEGDTEIAPVDALASCRRVRRPEEMAECVVSINNALASEPLFVLDNCRRSLLPDRYAECVVEIADAADVSVDETMPVCISAGDRPRDLAPSFIPRVDLERPDTPLRFAPLIPLE